MLLPLLLIGGTATVLLVRRAAREDERERNGRIRSRRAARLRGSKIHQNAIGRGADSLSGGGGGDIGSLPSQYYRGNNPRTATRRIRPGYWWRT